MTLYKKMINGKPYWYLREMARVQGKPKMVSERHLGPAEDIEKLLDAREAAAVQERTRHLGFGDSAAVWEVLLRLNVAGIIDEVVGARRSDAGASVGTYLGLAASNRVVTPTSKLHCRCRLNDRFSDIESYRIGHGLSRVQVCRMCCQSTVGIVSRSLSQAPGLGPSAY